jgi:hypothetical protein
MMTPPAPWIGSPMKAATFSAPSSRIYASSSSAAADAELGLAHVAAMAIPVGRHDLG